MSKPWSCAVWHCIFCKGTCRWCCASGGCQHDHETRHTSPSWITVDKTKFPTTRALVETWEQAAGAR